MVILTHSVYGSYVMRNQRIIGESSTLFEALEHVSLVAPLSRPVIVIGERGTGKELIAERLHYLSPRWENQLDKVNCAAISEALLDSELFGYEKGAFTGADKRHLGRFERADGGTLFLDELGVMPMRIQEKLLRVIEYGEFERLGGQKTITVDVRVVAATNADLPQMAKDGKFREDLLDRLAFDVISVPPLRQRREDIPELVEYFAVKMSHELGWGYYSGFTPEAMHQLMQYSWPGNIRELKNVVERSLYRWDDSETQVANVILSPFKGIHSEDSSDESGELEPPDEGQSDEVLQVQGFTDSVQQYELTLLKSALSACQYHQKNTAEHLGLTYHQMRALLRKYRQELQREKH